MATTSKSIGTPFGISTPPLLKYLQSILRGYSDGQILKELLQNAEDAGATEVQFIYDKNQYGTNFLVHDRLRDFQGPALCSYNNAIFTDDDWKAIQTPAQSGKKNNALKVGRFGIGFNSVYHITDLPCILSERYMAMIDPFERWFETAEGLRSSGCKWCLRDVLSNESEVDQLQPIKESFPEGVNFDEKGCLPGTMFRFPLRKSASKLCESVYTPEKTIELLDAFRDDAQIVLLFLRNIERVQIFCKEAQSSEPKLYLEVHFEEAELSNLRSIRQTFCSRLQEAKETSNYESNISMQTDFNVITRSEEITITERWVVYQEIMFQCSNELQSLFQKLKFLPWVGVAIPMFEQDSSVGRTFCFFPLPSGEESRSGLPVHVHGFFGVSDDRRSLKWPGGDQIQNEEAIWNKLLADEVLPEVYGKALLRATQVSVEYHIDPNIVYSAFPDGRQNLGYWSNAVSKLYKDLFTQPMLYCHFKEEWMTSKDVYILPEGLKEPNAQQKVVIKCLQLSGYDVIATLPDHVEHALTKQFSGQVQFVSSELVLSCLLENSLTEYDSQERMSLLAYLLDDDCDANSLNGLPLLPTKGGNFVQFTQYPAPHEVIYIETDECPQRLLPNTEHRFLATICDEEFTNLREKLKGMGLSDTWKQLQILTVQKLVELLRETLPPTWTGDDDTHEEWSPSSENQPDLKWLQEVWQFVCSKEVNLRDLHGLKLIPVTDLDTEPIKLMALMVPSKLIDKYPSCNQVPSTISKMEKVFRAVGVTVCKIPDFVSRYHQFRELFYVHSFTPNGILKVLQVIGQEVIERTCASSVILQSEFVSNIMAFLSGSMFSEADVLFLKRLRVFVDHGYRNSNNLISLDDDPLIINEETQEKMPPINIIKTCIHVQSGNMTHLLQKLGLQTESFDVVLQQYLTNAQSNKYCENEVKELLKWIKPQYETLRVISDVRNLLGDIRFVPSQMKSLKKPNEVFDTSDAIIELLIHDRHLLPCKSFLKEWLDVLRDLGIMNRADVQIDHIRRAAQFIKEKRDTDRAFALWDYLSDGPKCLYEDTNLCKTLKTVPFLKGRAEAPTSYPQNVPFYKRLSLCKPCEVTTYSEVNCQLVGATVPLLEVDANKDQKVVDLLGINKKPNVNDVIEQLKICVSIPISDPLKRMLHHIYEFLNEHVSRDNQIVKNLPEKWIYVGDQFVESSRVYLEESQATVDLRPFLSVLPYELKKYRSLFTAAGVISEVDTDVHVLLRVLNELKEPCSEIVTPQRRLLLAINVLRKLLEFDDALEDENVQTQLVVPTNCDEMKLLPPSHVCYCDTDWMRQGMTAEDLEVEDDEDPIYLVNDRVTQHMAERLGVVPLSKKLAGAAEIGGIKQSGQYEPLTVRLKNILRDGYQPDAIPKEMVQNAEDAGASEVKFMLDLRTNDDKMTALLDPAMKNVQGQALWVYNNAVFTDKDLDNITKLGGATKSEDGSKIGQFGLGFNSVYHITDVPSFVTRKYITFFDPHKTYLKRHIRGEGSGIQLNFLSSPKRMRRFRDQFLPYDGIFGCKILGDNDKPEEFNGTIFRLPLRNEESARRGDICPQSYCEENMKPLIKSICNSAINLLLFTEKVSSISVYLLEDYSTEESLLYRVNRTDIANNNCFKELIHKCMLNKRSLPEDVVIEMHFTSNWSERCVEYLDLTGPRCQSKEKWIKVASGGKGEARRISASEIGRISGLLPCGGVAWNPNSQFVGNAFCFLPLSVPSSGLPVCINGSFAVSPDRRSLWKFADVLQSTSGDLKSRWNNALCGDIIVCAYITLVQEKTVQNYGSKCKDSFFLWPNVNDTPTTGEFGKLVTSFYHIVANGTSETKPPVFAKNDRLLSIDEVLFGDTSIQENETMFPVFERVMQSHSGKTVIKLPEWVKNGFKEAQCISLLNKRTCTWISFYRDHVFPKCSTLDYEDIKLLVPFALQLRDETILNEMKTYECLPTVSSKEIVFKKPSELKDHCVFEHMYLEDEGVFLEPSFLHLLNEYQKQTIREIGGLRKYLTCEEVLERAATVKGIWSSNEEAAITRSNGILTYLNGNLNAFETLKDELQKVVFLPAVKGQESEGLECAKSIYSYDQRHLVGEVCFILSDKSTMPSTVSSFLNIHGKEVQFSDVRKNVLQIHLLQRTSVPNALYEKWTYLYMYLQSHLQDHEVLNFVRSEKCFLVEDDFVEARKLSSKGQSFPPYLYRIPSTLKTFKDLLKAAYVKNKFSAKDIIMALQSLEKDQNGQPLDNEMFNDVLTKLIKPLFDISKDVPPSLASEILLPDSSRVLHPSKTLCFCDLKQFEHLLGSEYRLSHNEIPLPYAKALGVKDIRDQMLKKYSQIIPGFETSIGENFGQREELLNRIKRIMEVYQCDFSVLKELVQNADDANATKVHFVLDCRRHPHDRLFYNSMKDLQGPALLAYNDKPFSDEDIKGIQKLGEGSKGDATDKTGRYGIGFNVVYNLTDCPMFLSGKDTLCIFDPTLKFINDASEKCPGRMFRPVDDIMLKTYEDIFNCFLSFEDEFPLQHGSLFRFPLRNKKSTLGGRVSTNDVEKLFETFKDEMIDVLLFLKSVTEVAISVCDDDGNIEKTYKVTAEYTQTSNIERSKFFRGLSESPIGPTVKDLHCKTKIRDSNGYEEDWLIHQRIGVEKMDNIPESVCYASSRNKLKLVAKGGVAGRIKWSDLPSARTAEDCKGKAYCFLPIPVLTNLPVHVDGYFALEHEARRNLWKAPYGDPKSDWNYLLTKEVIAPCYVLALKGLKLDITKSYQDTNDLKMLQESLEVYHSMFPKYPLERGTTQPDALEEICDAFYRQVINEKLPLFPVLSPQYGQNKSQFDKISLLWRSCISGATEKGFFKLQRNEENEKLHLLLITLGFPVLESPLEIYKALSDVSKKNNNDAILRIAPQHVTEFLRNDAKRTTLCGLPMKLENTLIFDKERLRLLLGFTSKACTSMDGLPLLLTQDDMLRVFSNERPVFHSIFVDILLPFALEFLHVELIGYLRESDSCFKKLTISDVVNRLPSDLPRSEDYVPWDRKIPTESWLRQLWNFLATTEPYDQYVVDAFRNWCIFPAFCEEQSFLLPLKRAKTVVSKSSRTKGDMYSVLKRLQCPFSTDDISCQPFSSQVNVRKDILRVLERQVTVNCKSFENLEEADHNIVLHYFEQEISELCYSDQIIMKKLPCFPSITGCHVALTGIVYAISMIGVPMVDHEKWLSNSSYILLDKAKLPPNVTKALNIKTLDEKDLYQEFILPYFKSFSSDAKWAHIDKLMEMVCYDSSPEKVVSRLSLKYTPIILSEDEGLHLASKFFDNQNPVFREMVSKDHFPPPHPNERKMNMWMEFLRHIGLQERVNRSQFEGYVQEVADDDKISLKREKVLVRYLFRSHHLHEEEHWLRKIIDIPFISAAKVSEEYNDLHRQCETRKVALSSVAERHCQLAWSTNALLPDWVNLELRSCVTCEDMIREIIDDEGNPTLDQILNHTITLFNFISTRGEEGQDIPVVIKYKDLLDEIVSKILQFLSTKCLKAETCGRCIAKDKCCDNCSLICKFLVNVPFVRVDGLCFKAKRLTKHLPKRENDKLFSYLREIPEFLGQYNKLLYCLGATDTPSLRQYASALEMMATYAENLKQNPPMYLAAEQAVNGFFTCLSKLETEDAADELKSFKKLFLLSKDKKLLDSTCLYFNDVHTFSQRLRRFPYPLLKQLPSSVKVMVGDSKKILKKMGSLQPKYVKDHISEVEVSFTRQTLIHQCQCSLSNQLMKVFHYKNFERALKCIMVNEGIEDLAAHENVFRTSFKICCCSNIQTKLHMGSEGPIPESEVDSGAIFKREADERVVIYLSHDADEALVYIQIARGFYQFFDVDIRSTTSFEVILKATTEEKLFEYLCTLGLNTTDSELGESFRAPLLGTDVEEDVVSLLLQSFIAELQPEEYVVYNKAESTDEHLVYAKVIAKVASTKESDGLNWRFNVQYIIDIGEERQVSAVWLYRFPCPVDATDISKYVNSKSVRLSSVAARSQETLFKDLDELKQEMTELLEALWKENENVRRTGVRRLMRTWHPDKHIEKDKRAAEEVFKHVMREVGRLKRGVPLDADSDSDVRKWAKQNTSQQNQYWRNHERRNRKRFYESSGVPGRSTGRSKSWRRWQKESFSTPQSFQKVNEDALRWQKQARADLNVASSLSVETDTNLQWKCTLCFFASEKSLRAAQLVCGCNINEKHNIVDAAISLKPHLNLLSLVERLVKIVQSNSHYPTSCVPPRIPCDIYNRKHAEETMEIAQKIITKVDAYFKQN